jgi:hypothetical protein
MSRLTQGSEASWNATISPSVEGVGIYNISKIEWGDVGMVPRHKQV